MAQKIQQANIFGRLGSGIGQGLAEQIPKEIDRSRLSAGLRDFAEKSKMQNMSPLETASALYSIPGVAENPQLVKTFGDLAQQQRSAQAYGRMGPVVAGEQLPNGLLKTSPSHAGVKNPFSTAQQQPLSDEKQRGIVETNPLDKRMETPLPWTPEKTASSVKRYLDIGFDLPTSRQLAEEDRQAEMQTPAAYQEEQRRLQEAQKDSRAELERQMSLKLQKTGEGLFQNITGDMITNLQKGLERDLRENPNLSLQDVADKWSSKALDMSKAKTQLDKTVETIGLEDVLKGDDVLNKFKGYQKIFEGASNLEEYFNILKEKGFSPLSASAISYPPSKNLQKFVDDYKKIPMGKSRDPRITHMPPSYEAVQKNIANVVKDLENHITKDDSILNIAQSLASKDPYFDKSVFFNELAERMDELRLTPRQKREIAEGKEGVFSSTKMDWIVMPWFGKKIWRTK